MRTLAIAALVLAISAASASAQTRPQTARPAPAAPAPKPTKPARVVSPWHEVPFRVSEAGGLTIKLNTAEFGILSPSERVLRDANVRDMTSGIVQEVLNSLSLGWCVWNDASNRVVVLPILVEMGENGVDVGDGTTLINFGTETSLTVTSPITRVSCASANRAMSKETRASIDRVRDAGGVSLVLSLRQNPNLTTQLKGLLWFSQLKDVFGADATAGPARPVARIESDKADPFTNERQVTLRYIRPDNIPANLPDGTFPNLGMCGFGPTANPAVEKWFVQKLTPAQMWETVTPQINGVQGPLTTACYWFMLDTKPTIK